jgi:type VII secretion-associated serine protease mycosin
VAKRMMRAAAAAALTLVATSAGVTVAPSAAHAETVRGAQYYLDTLNVIKAQSITKGAGVTVAVIDTGVDASHPDLSGQVLKGTTMVAGGPADGRADQDGHGTAMAGLIAGKGGGENHMLGIAPRAKILPISGEMGGAGQRAFTDGIRWAADHGAQVINISQGTPNETPTDVVIEAVRYALSKNVVVVAAAGNSATTQTLNVVEPANIPGVVAVAATTKNGSQWSESARGPAVALAAPGVDLPSTAPKARFRSGFSTSTGTSDSAAIVSGVLALIRAKYPDLDAANVINRLLRTTKDLGPAGRDPNFGFGQVDAYAALTASVPAVTKNPLLGADATPGAGTGTAQARPYPTQEEKPLISFGGTWWGFLLCLGGPIVGLVAVVFWVRSSRRKTRAAMAGGPSVSGWGPPQGPGGPAGPPPPNGPQTGGWPPNAPQNGGWPPSGQQPGVPAGPPQAPPGQWGPPPQPGPWQQPDPPQR